MRAVRCDSCGKRIRPSHHEARLIDAESGQVIGRYHGTCREAVAGYLTRPGAVLALRIMHPKRCGPDLERCDGGVTERVA